MGTTPNFGWVYPTPGANADDWGGITNDAWIAADASLKAVEDGAMKGSNNLSELTDVAAANTKLGLTDAVINGGSASVGIGMTAVKKLDVNGSGRVAGVFTINDTGGVLSLQNAGTEKAYVTHQNYNLGDGSFLAISTTGSTSIDFGIGNSRKVRIGTDGSLLVGSTTNAGAGAIAAAGNITAFVSDMRLKTDIEPITGALDKLKQLSGFTYSFNDTAKDMGLDAERHVGLSAQVVQSVQPEAVAPAPVNPAYLTVRYADLVPLLVEAIKELEARVPA